MKEISQQLNKCAKMHMYLEPANTEWRTPAITATMIRLLNMPISACSAQPFFYAYGIRAIEYQVISLISFIVVLVSWKAITEIFPGKTFQFQFWKKYDLLLNPLVLVGTYLAISKVKAWRTSVHYRIEEIYAALQKQIKK